MTDAERCGHPKDDGAACGTAFGLCPDCGWCFTHCEHREEARTAARRKGAERTNRPDGALLPEEMPPPLKSLEDAAVWAAWASYVVATGTMDPTRGNTVARLLKEFRTASERVEAKADYEETRRKLEERYGDGPDLEALP